MLDPAAEHVERRRLAVVEGHVPVLQAQAGVVDRALVLADVARGVDAGHRGLETGAALHSPGLAQLEPTGAGQRHVRHHPDSDHDHVAVELEPVLGHDLAHAAVGALEALQLVAAVHLHPVLLERVLEEAPDLAPELVLQRDLLLHHDRALHAVRRGQRGSHLAADVAAADQHGALGGLGVGADRVRVAERAQVVDALEVAAVDPHAAHVCAGRDQRGPELHLVLGRQRRHPLGCVELHHARPGHQLDVLLDPPLVGAEQDVLARLLALQVALRQRRPVVGRVELAADQQHRSLAALLAQPAGAVGGGESAADQQVVDLAASHPRPRVRWSGPRSARSRSSPARRRARAGPRRRPAPPSRRWARSRRRRAGSRSRASRRAGRAP